MHHSPQLYQQFMQRKNAKHHQSSLQHRRRAILSKCIDLPDAQPLNLQSSIPLLRYLGMITSIDSVEHIVSLMEGKRNGGWQGAERQLWQCRLIYFLWDVINNQQIDNREFKQLIITLTNEQIDRQTAIEKIFGSKEEIAELVQTWDRLFMDQIAIENGQPIQQINDISIIKSKNDGNFGDNKQNQREQGNIGQSSSRNSLEARPQQSKSRMRLQKSYQKKSAKSTLQRSTSAARINTKRSESRSIAVGGYNVHFFNDADSLTPADERRLVQRLYDCDKYRQREEEKRRLDEQRIKVELSGCTFKPRIGGTSRVKSGAREIKGYSRAVDRMKLGYQKKTELKQNLQYRMSSSNSAARLTVTQCDPPQFHSRPPKEQKTELFELKFTLGKMVIPVRVRASDSVDQLVYNVGRIYSLKEYEKVYIRDSIFQALQQYQQALEAQGKL